MELLNHVGMAFSIACEPKTLFLCFVGVLMGTLVGVLPGLGPAASISLLIPLTFSLTPAQSIIMLAGIYYGAYYGGSTTSILVNIPGEAASTVTCLDGYQMAKKGRAGPALGISAFGSFIAGTFAIILMMFLAPPLARIALKFGPPEYFSLMCLGLTMVTYLSSGSMVKALMMMCIGLMIGCVGNDLVTGSMRYAFGSLQLTDGFGLVPVIMGLFGISEVLINVEEPSESRALFKTRVRELFPTRRDWKDSAWPITRGSILGSFLGILPGGGGVLASFVSYAVEKRFSKHPERFGTGEIAGVAGPESANNAGAGTSFIPLLTLGIPCNAVIAILMGALMVHGVTPGPLLIAKHPDIFWGVIGSMYIGNALLLVLNLPLIGVWVKILKIPYPILFPLILLFCLIGAYSLNNNIFDVAIMIIFGVVGYLMKKFDYHPAPIVLALVLGPKLEESLRQSLVISEGSPVVFFTHPISAAFLVAAVFLLAAPLIFKKRPELEE